MASDEPIWEGLVDAGGGGKGGLGAASSELLALVEAA